VFIGHIFRQKFLCSNPAMNFKTYHLHNTNIRNYTNLDVIPSDIYIYLNPTYIIDTKQELTPPIAPDIISNETVSFEVKSSSMSNEITYCTMLEKDQRYKWEPSVENYYFEPNIPVYKWKNAAVTPNGLVYDIHTIYRGKYANDPKYNYWENAGIDILTPLQKRDKMIAIPFSNTNVFCHPDKYILNYISRCARLLKLYPGSSFWIPKQYAEYITYFSWDTNNLNAAIFHTKTGCWADEVIGFLPGPQHSELGSEDISALRSIYPEWIEKPISKICAVVISSNITKEFAEKYIADFLHKKDQNWTINYIDINDYASYGPLLGASLCIFIGGEDTSKTWAKLWALPKDCCVIEFQQELKIDGEFQHLAHVAGFKSWVLLLSKGTMIDVQEQIMEQLERWFIKNEEDII
jgi:hypothetical protein